MPPRPTTKRCSPGTILTTTASRATSSCGASASTIKVATSVYWWRTRGRAATTHTDDTVAANTTYTYRIKAINKHGTSERSRWVHIDTPAAP